MQVLWERGWINNENNNAYHYYTIPGRKNEYNLIMPETSLKSLMASCTDFEEEETLLQHMGKTMGVVIDQTPRCHAEIAGEGIEYSWGCAKNNHYQRVLLDRKGEETIF